MHLSRKDCSHSCTPPASQLETVQKQEIQVQNRSWFTNSQELLFVPSGWGPDSSHTDFWKGGWVSRSRLEICTGMELIHVGTPNSPSSCLCLKWAREGFKTLHWQQTLEAVLRSAAVRLPTSPPRRLSRLGETAVRAFKCASRAAQFLQTSALVALSTLLCSSAADSSAACRLSSRLLSFPSPAVCLSLGPLLCKTLPQNSHKNGPEMAQNDRKVVTEWRQVRLSCTQPPLLPPRLSWVECPSAEAGAEAAVSADWSPSQSVPAPPCLDELNGFSKKGMGFVGSQQKYKLRWFSKKDKLNGFSKQEELDGFSKKGLLEWFLKQEQVEWVLKK